MLELNIEWLGHLWDPGNQGNRLLRCHGLSHFGHRLGYELLHGMTNCWVAVAEPECNLVGSGLVRSGPLVVEPVPE